jgi:hypothetical protein
MLCNRLLKQLPRIHCSQSTIIDIFSVACVVSEAARFLVVPDTYSCIGKGLRAVSITRAGVRESVRPAVPLTPPHLTATV